MQPVAFAFLHRLAGKRRRIDRERVAEGSLHDFGDPALRHIAHAKVERARVPPRRRRGDGGVFEVERGVRLLQRPRKAHPAPHRRGPNDVPRARAMRREVDGRAAWAREPGPEAVNPDEDIIGEPSPDIGPELPVVLEPHAGGLHVDVAVHEPEIQAPKAALRIAARREIDDAHRSCVMPNRGPPEKRALR